MHSSVTKLNYYKQMDMTRTAPILLISFTIFHSCTLLSAQVQMQDCMNNLQPCLHYLNGNQSPPDTCCRPLDYVVRSMPECLCSLMTIQGSNQAEQAGINVTDAHTLPGRCGLRINPIGCITGTPDTQSSFATRRSSSIAAAVVFAGALGFMILEAV